MTLTVATWNVNGIRAREDQFLAWLEAARPDVVCLQEIKASTDKLSERLCGLAGYHCYWHGHAGYSGVGLHLRQDTFPAPPDFSHPAFDHETRIVTATTAAGGDGGLTVASIYVPNGGKDFQAKLDFLAALRGLGRELRAAGRPFLLCGDLNVARTDMDLHPKERKKKPQIGTLPEERELLEAVLAEGLTDVGRALDPDNDRLYTWWAPWRNLRERNIGWRIDYVLASEELADKAVSCQVFREIGTSDHAPVVARFEV
jgi:exodeoxyribonuclease-3